MHNTVVPHLLTDAQAVPEQQSVALSQLPPVYVLDIHPVLWNIPLSGSGHLSWPCSLWASCAPAAQQSVRHCKVLDLG